MLVTLHITVVHNRSQVVVFDGAKSEARIVNRGVPQDSVLGFLFFLIFIDDVQSSCGTSNTITPYADDKNFLLKAPNRISA